MLALNEKKGNVLTNASGNDFSEQILNSET